MRVQIEMDVPDDMDPSTILEKMQEIALEFAEEQCDEGFELCNTDAITNEVSVLVMTEN